MNGKVYSLDEVGELEKNKRHSIELVVDRLIMKPDIKKRVADSVELALSKGSDSLIISIVQALVLKTVLSPLFPHARSVKFPCLA